MSPTEMFSFDMASLFAVICMVAGLVIFVRSFLLDIGVARHKKDPERALSIVQSFRIGIIGLCLTGVGCGIWFELTPLFWLSLIIGGEELLESTVIITALRHSPDIA